jgi:hypothetical protein
MKVWLLLVPLEKPFDSSLMCSGEPQANDKSWCVWVYKMFMHGRDNTISLPDCLGQFDFVNFRKAVLPKCIHVRKRHWSLICGIR